jgi:putative hydrolase of the HAD superfamily
VAFTTLLVDWGGVLTTPLAACMGHWCEADAVDPVQFAAVMKDWLGVAGAAGNPVHALETGALAVPDFERELAARLRTHDGRPLEPAGLLQRMFAGFQAEPAMTDVVRRARAAGLRTGLVSNSWGNDYPREAWSELFDAVVISGEVGLRKPDPDIYRLAAERVGVEPSACVFVDDLPPNVRGAAAVGMAGVLHQDVARTRAELSALFDLAL